MSDKSLREQFGIAVRLCRERIGMSQSDLAGKLGTSQAQISEIERGRANATVDMIERLSGALDVPPITFFGTFAGPAAMSGLLAFLPVVGAAATAAMAFTEESSRRGMKRFLQVAMERLEDAD